MKSKMLQRFIEDTTRKIKEPKTTSNKMQFIVSGESRASNSSDDGDYGNTDGKNDGDYSCSEHDSDDDYNYSEDNTEDGYSYSEDDSDSDSSDGDTDNADGTDVICAICDDGGKLLSCIGPCKRSFHPRLKDGRQSQCKALGYTSAQLKGITTFLCKNCEYKQHQCFKCGELEPSDELNAKVFKCNNASCGHFYHPKCVAKLLEPDDGACELVKRIATRMSFTCPVHWCFKCGKMEDRTQRALQFAVCRRCPKSYHRECLPRKISFEPKGKHAKQRAWELPNIILIYCGDHKIYEATGTAGRNHIKFPRIPELSKTSCLVKMKVKMSGKRKMNVDLRSTKSTELLNRLCREEIEQTQRLDVDSLSEHMVLNPECAAKRLKEDLQFEPPVVGADASLSGLEGVKGQDKQFGTLPFVTGTRIPMSSSCVVGRQTEDRVTSKDDKETSSGASHDIARKRVMPSAKGMYCPSVQDILPDNHLVDKDAERDRIKGDKGSSERDETSEHYSGEESGAPNKDTSHENHEQNDVLYDLVVEKHAEEDGSKLKSGKETGIERGKNAYGHDFISGQTEEISGRENRIGKTMRELDSRSEKGKIARNDSNKSGSGNGEVTLDHIDDHPTEKKLHVVHADKLSTVNRTYTKPEYGYGEDQEVNESYACQEKQNSSQCNDNPKVIEIDTVGEKLKKRREPKEKATGVNKAGLDKNREFNHIDARGAHYEDGRPVHPQTRSSNQCPAKHKEPDFLDCRLKISGLIGSQCNDGSAAAEASKCKSRERTGSNRTEEAMHNIRANSSNSPVRRNAQTRSRNYSPEGQRMDHRDNFHGTNNRRTYEQQRHVSYSSNAYVDRWWRSSWESAFPPADFGTCQRHSPPPYLSRENGIARRCSPRGPEYGPSRRHSSFRPRTPEEVNHTMDWNNSHNHEYDLYRTSRRCASPPYPRRPEHGKSRRHSPPFSPRSPDLPPFPRNPGYGIGRRYSPPCRPRRSEDVDYTMDWNSSPNIHYELYDEYGGYEAMDIDPVAIYSSRGRNDGTCRPPTGVRGGEHDAAYGHSFSDYGERSDYVHKNGSKWGSGSVTDKYAPRLDQTNHRPIGESNLHYDLPPVW